jgi:hypothetical protein
MAVRNSILRASLLLVVAASPTFAADAPVTVDRKSPTTHTRTFDPKSPPPDVHLTGHEAAYTRSTFLCSAAVSYRVTSKSAGSATIRIDSIQVELNLDDTLFLPKNAPKKLTAHEQGHRQIAERIYLDAADDTARRLAAPLVGQTFTATGPTPDAAADAAAKSAVQKFCDDYTATIPARSSTVNDLFDKLTDHGRNKLPEPDAIRQAFQKADATRR